MIISEPQIDNNVIVIYLLTNTWKILNKNLQEIHYQYQCVQIPINTNVGQQNHGKNNTG